MIAFWQMGYSETPIGVLEEATGVKRVSLYNAFGDKEGLFLAALDHYHAAATAIYEGKIANGGLGDIQELFTAMSSPVDEGSPAHSGCLMVNTILDVRRASEPVRAKVIGYRNMLKSSFTSALNNAQTHGEMHCSSKELDQRADYLVGLLWGALAMIRVDHRTTAAAPVAAEGNKLIDTWRCLPDPHKSDGRSNFVK
ncbi:MAG: TetR/AcrR family transcriptional regulator [Pseudomonadota bacterium]